MVRRLPNTIDVVHISDDVDRRIRLAGGRSAEAKTNHVEHVGYRSPGLALVAGKIEPRVGRRVRAVALHAGGPEEITRLSGHGHDFRIEAVVARDRPGVNLRPRLATVRRFEHARAREIQVESVCENPVRGDRAAREVIGEIEFAPAGNAGQRDRTPGLAAVECVIGLVAVSRRPDEIFRRAGRNCAPDKRRPSAGDFGGELCPRGAAVGRITGFLDAPPIGDADKKARRRRGVVDRPAGDYRF